MNAHRTASAILTGLVYALLSTALHADLTQTSLGITPLTDMRNSTYQGYAGGLYPDYANTPSPVHASAGLHAATNIVPLDANGQPSSTGKIVLVSVGMSNTSMEFSRFVSIAMTHATRNNALVVVDGAQSGQAYNSWTNVYAPTWTNVDMRLASAGVNSNQVQAVWLKQATINPSSVGDFPYHAWQLADGLQQIVRNLKTRYPNVKVAYLSSRTRAYITVSGTLNPEPYACESAFSVRWAIEAQMNGASNLNYDVARGLVCAPWIKWGPYLWADGTNSRSDGFTWPTNAVNADFVHPSTVGQALVATQLLAFFSTDATAAPWFLKRTVTGAPPICAAAADVLTGTVPFTVNFTANASDPDGTISEYLWTFDDGTFSVLSNSAKVFDVPGVFDARVTVADNRGNPTTCLVRITAVAPTNENHTPYLAVCQPMTIYYTRSGLISNTLLRVADSESAAANITFLIVSNTARGALLLNGVPLATHSIFTQDDINNLRLAFTNRTGGGWDRFYFSVSDGADGAFSNAHFRISIMPEPAVLGVLALLWASRKIRH